MTVLSRFRAGLSNPAVPITSTSLIDWLGLGRSAAGREVSEESALGMPSVWRAVNLLAGTAASLPLHAFRQQGVARVQQTSGNAAELLSRPHPDMTPFELWELGYGSALLWGNATYLKLWDSANRLRELWWLHPDRVNIGRASDGTKVYKVKGFDRALSDREVLHVPGFGFDGIKGASVIRLAREGIGLAQAAEEYGARLFGSGSLATGLLTTEQSLDQEEADALKARWKAGGTGLASAHDIRVLGSGARFEQLSIPPEDAQFIETRRFQIEEIARLFGVPPHMLGETAKSTSWGTGLEEQNLGFLIYTLRPWLTRFEQRISAALRPEPVYARYSVEGLLRGNSTARAEFYTKMWQLGVFSTNDIRALEELPPVDGGDVRYRPLNMGVLGESDASAVDAPDPALDPSQDDTVSEPAAVTTARRPRAIAAGQLSIDDLEGATTHA